MMELNSTPFQLMRLKHGVPILMFLQAEEKSNHSHLQNVFGGQWSTIENCLKFMIDVGYVHERDLGEHKRPRYEYSLTPLGRKVAHVIKSCYDQLLQVPQNPEHARNSH